MGLGRNRGSVSGRGVRVYRQTHGGNVAHLFVRMYTYTQGHSPYPLSGNPDRLIRVLNLIGAQDNLQTRVTNTCRMIKGDVSCHPHRNNMLICVNPYKTNTLRISYTPVRECVLVLLFERMHVVKTT